MMVLADTSVWIQHFRGEEPALASLLVRDQIVMHPFVCGELACGNLKDRTMILNAFQQLPQPVLASTEEVLELIAAHRLWGRGLDWIDVHLLASARLSNCRLWTFDARLAKAAAALQPA